MSVFKGDKNKTFKPQKKIQKGVFDLFSVPLPVIFSPWRKCLTNVLGTKMAELHKQAKATLGIAQNLRLAVKLPAGEDINEWLAVHVRFHSGYLYFYRRSSSLCRFTLPLPPFTLAIDEILNYYPPCILYFFRRSTFSTSSTYCMEALTSSVATTNFRK
jgi:hypothetical protein